MAFLSNGIEIDPQLPLDAECRVDAGGKLLGWLCIVLFLPIACFMVYAFAENLREHYFAHDLHFNFSMVFVALSCMLFVWVACSSIQRVRSAHLPVILLRPGELRFCNSLAPIALTDIQAIEYSFYRNSAIVTLIIKPQAALPLLAPHRFGMPDGRRVWRKHRVMFSLLQSTYAGQLVTNSSVIQRMEQYWAAANSQRSAGSVT
ncbi:hypothetical protein HX870_29135 [Pseudomonas gingeri]|uniref:hypothetical protein n=1 Tax=Pseudomonas gingeri TaxID=117681 RepID=UPI0015A13FA9|nr:hypothetical protein [Pseudomonas gingeri]NWA24845.1 hypothetical protein [Pseudomonas gingeri]NWD71676.1 hypothetical protein [Pseudomonas gingeri]NWD74854.1 hypothetical protein [Pseudomonas gingeri]